LFLFIVFLDRSGLQPSAKRCTWHLRSETATGPAFPDTTLFTSNYFKEVQDIKTLDFHLMIFFITLQV